MSDQSIKLGLNPYLSEAHLLYISVHFSFVWLYDYTSCVSRILHPNTNYVYFRKTLHMNYIIYQGIEKGMKITHGHKSKGYPDLHKKEPPRGQ